MADMVSVGHNVNAVHDIPVSETGSAKEVILVPPPSSHPDDPLNWSPKRKALPTLCVCL
ncbi:hypothetical protein ACHAP3_006990 [Botrytis cinerea]